MKHIVLSESPDGVITDFTLDPSGNKGEFSAEFKFSNSTHFGYAAERVQEGTMRFDLRSRIAQIGYNADPYPSFDKPDISIDSSRKSMTLHGAIYPWWMEALPVNAEWWHLFQQHELHIGKLVNLGKDVNGNPLLVSKEELEERINREMGNGVDILFNQGSQLNGDLLRLALDGRAFQPNPMSTYLKTLADAISGDNLIPRERLNELRLPPKSNLPVIVPAASGSLVHTVVKSNELSIALDIQQEQGVRHTSAFYCSPHSALGLFIELIGNGIHDAKMTHINAKLYRSDEVTVEDRVLVPSSTFPPKNPQIKPLNRSYYVYTPRSTKPVKISPHEPKSLRRFDTFLRNHPHQQLYFHTFPSSRVMEKIQSYAAEGLVDALVFSVPPIADKAFDREHHDRIKRLTSYGARVVWQSDDHGILVYHRKAFVRPEMRPVFDKAYASNSILLLLCSHRDLNQETLREVEAVLHGHKQITGGNDGYGTLINGGGPGGMRQTLHLAQGLKMYTGSINLVKEGEYQAYDAHKHPSAAFERVGVDFVFPFQMGDINTRQGTLFDIGNAATIVTECGVGGFYEFYEKLVKAGFTYNIDPVFLLGDPDFFRPTLEQIAILNERNRINPLIMDNIVQLPRGRDYVEAYKHHYKVELPRRIH